MAKPLKFNAKYFSHDADMRNDVKIKAIRSKFGLDGYAVWCMLLEVFTDCDYFELSKDEFNLELLAADFGVGYQEFKEMLNYFEHLQLITIGETSIYSEQHKYRLDSVLKVKMAKSRGGKRGMLKRWHGDGEPDESEGSNESEESDENDKRLIKNDKSLISNLCDTDKSLIKNDKSLITKLEETRLEYIKEKNKKEKEKRTKEMEEGNYDKFLKWTKTHIPNISRRYKMITRKDMDSLINVYGKLPFFDALRSAEEDFINHSIFHDDNLYDILCDKLDKQDRRSKKPLSNEIPLITDIIDADTSQWSDEEYLDKIYPHLQPNNPYRLTKRVLDREADDKKTMRAALQHIKENGERDNEPKRDFLKYRYCVEMVRDYYNAQLNRFGSHLAPWDKVTYQQLHKMRRRLYVNGLDGVKHSIDILVRNRLLSEIELNYKSSRGVNWILDDTKYAELMNGAYDNVQGYTPLEPLENVVDVSSTETPSISLVDSPNFVEEDGSGTTIHNEGSNA